MKSKECASYSSRILLRTKSRLVSATRLRDFFSAINLILVTSLTRIEINKE